MTRQIRYVGLVASYWYLCLDRYTSIINYLLSHQHPSILQQVRILPKQKGNMFGASFTNQGLPPQQNLPPPSPIPTGRNSNNQSDTNTVSSQLSGNNTINPTATLASNKKLEIVQFLDAKNITFTSKGLTITINVTDIGSKDEVDLFSYCRSLGTTITFDVSGITIDTSANHNGGSTLDGSSQLGTTITTTATMGQQPASVGISPLSNGTSGTTYTGSRVNSTPSPVPPQMKANGKSFTLDVSQCQECRIIFQVRGDNDNDLVWLSNNDGEELPVDDYDIGIINLGVLNTGINYKNSSLRAVHSCCLGCRDLGVFLPGGISTCQTHEGFLRCIRDTFVHMGSCPNMQGRNLPKLLHTSFKFSRPNFAKVLELNGFEDSTKQTVYGNSEYKGKIVVINSTTVAPEVASALAAAGEGS